MVLTLLHIILNPALVKSTSLLTMLLTSLAVLAIIKLQEKDLNG